jgi:hypothetical protein
MKKSLFLVLPVLAIAIAGCCGRHGHKHGGHRKDLTAEQKACLDAQACPKPEFKKGEGHGKDGESRECMKKAFETCGIEKHEHGKGKEKPEE